MRIPILLFLLTAGGALWADNLPEWLAPLREAVYEQKLKADAVKPIYQAAKTAASRHYTGAALDTALSRCEYFMGRVLEEEKRIDEARAHYNEGMRLAEKAIAAAPSAEAWQALMENLAQNCSIGPWSYTAANGLNVEKYAKNALAFNKRNASAQFAIAARWIFAPAPFHNYKKGVEMMEAIISEGDMGKDDRFNVYTAIGYGYIQQKKHADARPWILKSLEIYPSNQYAIELLNKK